MRLFLSITFLLCLFVVPVHGISIDSNESQISEAKVKAALILNFAQNVQWKNDDEISVYRIGIMDADTSIYGELKLVEKTYRIKGKSFEAYRIPQNSDLSSLNILYLNESNSNSLSSIYSIIKGKNILLITDRSTDRVLTMINLLYNKEKRTYSFEINKDNLDANGFTLNPKILLLGGSYINIKELYIQTYEKLHQESLRLQENMNELERISKEKDEYSRQIAELNEKINTLAVSIKQSESEYNVLTKKLEVKDSVLARRTRELQSKVTESQSLQKLIKEQLSSINEASKKLDSLNDEISIKRTELEQKQIQIENQNEIIGEKENIILRQQKSLYITIVFVLGLLLSLVFAFWGYRIKRRMNLNLERLVDERTRELQISHEHYISLFENSPIAMFELDLSALKNYINTLGEIDKSSDPFSEKYRTIINTGLRLIKVINLNQAAMDLFGYTTKEDAAANFFTSYDAQTAENFKTVYFAMVESRNFCAYDGVRKTKNGGILYVHLKWSVLPGYENNYAKVILSVSDITALKNYQKELNRHKEHLEEIVLERTNEIIKLNNDLTLANAELQQKTEELTQIIQMLNDTQDQLIQSEKMASLGMLTAGIAHEINNPINYISGSHQALGTLLDDLWELLNNYREVISKKLSKDIILDNEQGRDMNINDLYYSMKFLLSNIETGINRTTEIIKSLMAFSRNETQAYADYDIHAAVRDVLIILKTKYFGRISINEEYDKNLPALYCNANGINQVIMNLVSNAIDAIPNQGQVSILANYNKTSDEIVIKISDNGAGIPDNIIDKIFDPFFTTKEVGKGTGLGLYISYNMIKSHHGTIDVESKIGVGTTFTVRLPRKTKQNGELSN